MLAHQPTPEMVEMIRGGADIYVNRFKRYLKGLKRIG